MFEMPTPVAATPRPVLPHTGAEPVLARLFALAFDEIDYGMLLLDGDGQVLHLNHAARDELDAQHPLQLLGRTLRTRDGRDIAPLHQALHDAARRGLRKLLTLGEGESGVSLSVVPLFALAPGHAAATMLMLGRRQACEQLSVQAFARSVGLTGAETRVLEALCAGRTPTGIAVQQGVAVCTVRSQIGSIRVKTGAASIRDLVQRVATLPPMMKVLRRLGTPAPAGANDMLLERRA